VDAGHVALAVFLTLFSRAAGAGDAAPGAPEIPEPGWQVLGHWRQPEGLPQNTVYAVLQAQDGYIWLGTKAGVARFDGVRFTRFDNRNPERLKDNEVWSLTEGDDGSVWFGTYGGGVSRYQDGRFTVLTTADGLVHDYVVALAKDAHGAIWIGTDGGVSRLANGRFTSFTTADGLATNVIRGLYCDADGSVWVGTVAGGIHHIRDGRVETPHFAGATPSNEVRSFLRDADGSLWITTFDGLLRLSQGTLTRFTTEDGLSSNRTRQLYADARGDLWVISDRGLDRIRLVEHRPVITRQYTSLDLTSIAGDREGSLWVGSFIDGLLRLRQGIFTTYTQTDGLADYYVGSVLEDHQGTVWVGTRKGLSRIAGPRAVSYDQRQGLSQGFVLALGEDHEGHLWVGTDVGVYQSDEPTECVARGCVPRFHLVGDDALKKVYSRVLYAGRDGAMWVGTDHQGLARYERGRTTWFTTQDGLASNAVRALGEDGGGRLWIGTRGGGLCRRENARFDCYGVQDGLAGTGIQTLFIDGDDTLWLGTRQGVSRLRGGRFTTYTVNDGLFDSFVYSFLDDGVGNFWMGSAQGIFRVGRQELNAFIPGKSPPMTSVPYGVEHGLRCTVAVVGSAPTSFRSRDGRLWFGTNDGLSVVDPPRLVPNAVAPPVRIEELTIDDRPYDQNAPIVAAPGQGDLEIHYTGLSFVAPDKVRFKYRLEGFDPDWVNVGTRRVAYYTNLPAGTYHFRVTACNNDGLWSAAGATVDVSLQPHFYKTPWFFGLCAAALILAGAATQRLRVAGLQARERELDRRVKEALAQIDTLQGLLPICAACKKIRDDKGTWNQIESYIAKRSSAEFSHSICPDCMVRLYPGYVAKGQGGSGGE
jgi:ligand-binding sensor domain-containing protein